ncbi:MFS transporter [Rubellicoccus peritrichatus]|uniref:MFS transporter n=1 Tax=Rubellicoccus peritrichatus TaxID=3080537 RepID=A0AAQ3LC36_9BACT|nr:MFS transporter [Puniceicoccus sp. CR14]WOO41140.1 MFS transporter [Puniceicoccus sp. CR14]
MSTIKLSQMTLLNSATERRCRISLACTNFALADVRDGLMPFMAIYLMTVHDWKQGQIGTVIAIMSICGLLAQTPMGALVDSTSRKRLLLSTAAIIVALSSLSLVFFPTFWPVAISKGILGAVASVFAPAIAAITLGIWGQSGFTAQIGRNEAFNHGGNVFSALVAGVLGYTLGMQWAFYFVAFSALVSVITINWIPGKAIDNERARGLTEANEKQGDKPSGFATLFESKPLLIFSLCILLFHFANAAMLPLVSEKLSKADSDHASLYVSACVVLAQLVMIPMAILVGRKADTWGRKPIFLVGFLILPIRGVLFTLSDYPFYLMSVQVLDGIGAGIFGALFPIVIADLTRGTGRYNVAQGAVFTLMGIGVALSNLIAGYVAEFAGFSAAFYFLAAVAGTALALLWFAMPETLNFESEK